MSDYDPQFTVGAVLATLDETIKAESHQTEVLSFLGEIAKALPREMVLDMVVTYAFRDLCLCTIGRQKEKSPVLNMAGAALMRDQLVLAALLGIEIDGPQEHALMRFLSGKIKRGFMFQSAAVH